MGASLRVKGIKPADGKYKKMLDAWRACRAAKLPLPAELCQFFFGHDYDPEEEPNEKGVEVYLDKGDKGVVVYEDDMRVGFDIDLREIDPDVKIIRAYVSY